MNHRITTRRTTSIDSFFNHFRYLLICICSHVVFSTPAFCQQVDTISTFSRAMGRPIKTVVVKPSSYLNNTLKYHVVYLLHGYSGSYNNWIKRVPILPTLANEYNCIIVCPDGGYAGWYIDSKVDTTSLYETYITKELISAIDAKYSTIKTKEGRAITGLSMGGHGALKLALEHQDMFGAAGTMSGAVDLSGLKYGMEKLFPDSVAIAKASVVNIADTFSNVQMPLIIDCGINDAFISQNRDLHTRLLKRKIPHTYIERDGGHTWDYWANALPYHLLFFRNYFQKKSTVK